MNRVRVSAALYNALNEENAISAPYQGSNQNAGNPRTGKVTNQEEKTPNAKLGSSNSDPRLEIEPTAEDTQDTRDTDVARIGSCP